MGPGDVGQLLVVPMVVGLLATWVAMWWIGDKGWARWRGWAVAVIIGGVYVLGHVQSSRFPPFPAVTSDEWVVYAAMVGAGWAGVEAWAGRAMGWRWIVVAVGRVGVMAVLAWVLIGDRFGVAVYLGLVAGLSVVAMALVNAGRQAFGRSLMVGWAMVSAALGAAFLMGASAKLAILVWSLMATLMGVMAVLSLSKHGRTMDLGAVQPLLVMIVGGLSTSGTAYAGVSLQAVLLAAVGLCFVAFVGALAARRLMERWWWTASMVFLYGLLAGATVGLAQYEDQIDAAVETPKDEGGDEEEEENGSGSERYAPYRY